LRKRTLLLLGAGSSKDFGFPLGPELTKEISDALRFDTSDFRLAGGNENIRMLIEHARMHQPQLFPQYLKAADHICRSVHLSSSIDRFLESNHDKPFVAELAKLAISQVIASYESKSPLGVEPHRIPFFDTSAVATTWLAKWFGFVHTNRAEAELEAVFENVRVVTFNYDRTFEQFIILAVCNFYQVTSNRALELLNNIHITHVYGSLGQLTSGFEHQAYATCSNDIEVASRRIQTFHESIGSETIAQIDEAVQWCERVFCLGFSFAPMNMGLLDKCKLKKGLRPVFATNFEVSDFNSDIARGQLEHTFCHDNPMARMVPVKCAQFFDDIQLTI
jgi:hypothetical protein